MSRVIAFAAALVVVLTGAPAKAAPVDPAPLPSVSFNGTVHSAVIWGDVIYVAGEFDHAVVNSVRYPRHRLAAMDRRNGALLAWMPSADGTVSGIAADATGVYVAGAFNSINNIARDSLAKLDLISGSVLDGFNHEIYGHANTVAVAGGRVYLGGTLTSVDGVPRQSAAAFDAMTGELQTGWAPKISGAVYTILPAAERLYLGGRFNDINGIPGTQKLAAVRPATGAVDTSFVSHVHALVHGLQLGTGNTLYAGIDGNGGLAMAMDLAGNPKWTVTTDGGVQAIAELDGIVYLGGHFDSVCKSSRTGPNGTCLDGKDIRIKLAAVDRSGKLLSWTANGNGTFGVYELLADTAHGQLAVGGEFTAINNAEQRRFALFRLI